MKIARLISMIVFALLSVKTPAAGLYLEGGIHVGGDELAAVTFTSGDTEKIRAGELLSLAIGAHFNVADTLQARASIGYKFDIINADNGDFEFTRVPLEFLLMKRLGNWMLGGGLTRHLSPEFTADAGAIGASGTAEFDDSTGIVLAIDHISGGDTSSHWILGVRYTGIDYENRFGSASGDSIGLVIGFLF